MGLRLRDRMAASTVVQIGGGLSAVIFTAVVMSTQISDRRGFASSELRADVIERWGAPIEQPAPSVLAVESGSVFRSLESLPLASQQISVGAEMSYRKRGLVYFSGFDLELEAQYTVLNPRSHTIDLAFVFPISLQRNRVLLSDLRFLVDGAEEPIRLGKGSSHLLWTGRLDPGQEILFTISFSGRGLDSFVYRADPSLPMRGFALDLEITGGSGYDYPVGVAPASLTEELENGQTLRWEFSSLESGVPVGVILPSERSFDTLIARMARRSWVGYLLLAICCHALARHIGHWPTVIEVWLAASTYAFFFVLLPYLSAFMSFYIAYILTLLIICSLLLSYLRHSICRGLRPDAPGRQAASAEITRALVATLIAALITPTAAVILEGYTGLIYSLEILALLAALMWISTRRATAMTGSTALGADVRREAAHGTP